MTAAAWTTESHSARETVALGRRIGLAAQPGDVVALVGDLGSGKTRLAKGMAEGLGAASAREVTSPTFVICREYLGGRIPFYHLDAYRLKGAADLEAVGSDEILSGDGLSVVEWADRAAGALPADHLEIRLDVTGETTRRLTFTAQGEESERLLGRFRTTASGGGGGGDGRGRSGRLPP